MMALNSDGYSLRAANYQIRNLTRVWSTENDNGRLRRVKKCVGSHDLALAMDNLLTLDMIGITEEMERSIALFCDCFGLPLLALPDRLNETQSEQSDDALDVVRCRIRELNDLDCQIYEFGRRLFEERYDKMLKRYGVSRGCAKEELAALRPEFMRRFLDKDHSSVSYFGSTIDMSSGLIAEGLAQRFFYEPIGRWLRWIERGRGRVVYLPLGAGSAVRLSLEIAYVRDNSVLEGLSFWVGDRRLHADLHWVRWDDGGLHLVAEIELPSVERRADYTPLCIRTPESSVSGETAQGGVCLSRIKVS